MFRGISYITREWPGWLMSVNLAANFLNRHNLSSLTLRQTLLLRIFLTSLPTFQNLIGKGKPTSSYSTFSIATLILEATKPSTMPSSLDENSSYTNEIVRGKHALIINGFNLLIRFYTIYTTNIKNTSDFN